LPKVSITNAGGIIGTNVVNYEVNRFYRDIVFTGITLDFSRVSGSTVTASAF